ncbi:MAG: YggS family pyridoxal phosphate-dependent enzyme, partial [Oscillospiraceae bacterium]|nr:YggS family pyridoxal phosphate-dependent enzyme [Oscillospiraceae bacterium]
MDLQKNIKKIRAELDAAAVAAGRDPASVTLLAATKTQSSDTIRAAIAAGVTVCGENRVQEFTAHLADNAYQGAEVHFIGHLQTNKVKYVVGKAALIHSVSSEKLLRAIAAQ